MSTKPSSLSAVEEPVAPTSTSFNIQIVAINANWALIIDPQGVIDPRLVAITQPQQFVQAFVDVAENAVRVLSKSGSISWGPGLWRVTVEKVKEV